MPSRERPEPKNGNGKRLSLWPLTVEAVLKALVQTDPPKKHKAPKTGQHSKNGRTTKPGTP
jgi:hypothetical protein